MPHLWTIQLRKQNDMTTKEKIKAIEIVMPIVRFDEDLDLLEGVEKEAKELKRIVQDCEATVECEGMVEKHVNELNHYTDKLFKLIFETLEVEIPII